MNGEQFMWIAGSMVLGAIGIMALWHAIRAWYVTVSPDEWVIHYRNGTLKHMGRGLSFFCLPYDTYLKVPSTIRDINFVADQITKEKQGVRVQGFLAYKVTDFELAYQCLDLRSKTMRVIPQCEENVQNVGYEEKNREQIISLDPSDPLAKTDLVIRRLAESVVRHEVSNKTVEQMITERESVIRSMKEQLQETVRGWGIEIDTIEFTEVWIRSKELFESLQAEYRNRMRFEASRSNASTERAIAEHQLEAEQEIAKMKAQNERQVRVTTSEESKVARETEISNASAVEALELEKETKLQEKRLAREKELARLAREKEFALRTQEMDLAQKEQLLAYENDTVRQTEAHKIELDRRSKNTELQRNQAETARQLQELSKQKEIEEAELERQRLAVMARAELEAEQANSDRRRIEVEAQAAEIERLAEAERQKAGEYAEAIRKRGEAEADALRMKMEAENVINGAKLQRLFIEALPEVARAMAPGEVKWVHLGGGDKGGTPMELVPETIGKVMGIFEGMGLDLNGILQKMAGGTKGLPESSPATAAAEAKGAGSED